MAPVAADATRPQMFASLMRAGIQSGKHQHGLAGQRHAHALGRDDAGDRPITVGRDQVLQVHERALIYGPGTGEKGNAAYGAPHVTDGWPRRDPHSPMTTIAWSGE